MRSIRTSVIVVAYNAAEYLHPCMESLLATVSPDDEIIVVDNASTDGGAGMLESAFPGVCVVRSDVNLGFGGGNNLGARTAAGRYLAFINPDTVALPGWLDALVSALDADPAAGLATSKILLLNDSQRINTCGNEVHFSGLTLCRGMGLEATCLDKSVEVPAVSGAAFLLRRELFDALGGFDESLFMYMEDTDLSWRARLLGNRCVYVPGSVILHDYRLRFGPLKTYQQERNRYISLLKVLRWRTLAVLLPVFLMTEAVTWGFVLIRERRNLSNKFKAYAWVIAHWDAIMFGRRATQGLRRVNDRELIALCTPRLAYGQTGQGPAVRLAEALFDPIFLILQGLTLAVTRW